MKKVTLANTTDAVLVLENEKVHHEIAPHSQEKIKVEGTTEFRVFKKNYRSSRFCISQFLQRDTFRNIWLFVPMVAINLDSHIKLSEKTGKIEISERKYHFYIFALFHVLTFNGEFADTNSYRKTSDKRKLNFLSVAYSIPFLLWSLVFAVGSAGAVFDFSLENVIISLLCLISTALFIAIFRTFRKVTSIDRLLKSTSNDLKQVTFYIDYGRRIKFSDK